MDAVKSFLLSCTVPACHVVAVYKSVPEAVDALREKGFGGMWNTLAGEVAAQFSDALVK